MSPESFDTTSHDENTSLSTKDDEKKIRAHIFVSGKVQGVYFRKYTAETAMQNNIVGWVRNLIDGRVECVAEGRSFQISNLINWCRIGPSNAIVDNVEINYEPYVGEFSDFIVTG